MVQVGLSRHHKPLTSWRFICMQMLFMIWFYVWGLCIYAAKPFNTFHSESTFELGYCRSLNYHYSVLSCILKLKIRAL